MPTWLFPFGRDSVRLRNLTGELAAKGLLFDFRTWPPSGIDAWPPIMEYPSGVKVYDAYSPEARDIYWKYLNEGIFKLGMDAWWMDSTEPDHVDPTPEDLDTSTSYGCLPEGSQRLSAHVRRWSV